MRSKRLTQLSDFVQQQNSICDFATSDSWVILSPIEQSIKKKIEAVGTPLKDWDINIYRGVLTGCNEAFIIDSEKREEILANCQTEDERQRTAELIRPILRGRDIKRYGYVDNGLYLINTHNGVRGRIPRIKIEDYPAVKAHLDQYWDRIATRADKGDTPYNLRNCAYLEDFFKPKIVWARLMRIAQSDIDAFPRFCYAPGNFFVVDSLCFFSGKNIEQIVLALNSEYAAWYFFNNVATLDNGGFQMRQQYVEEIPLPDLSRLTSDNTDKQIYDGFGFNKEEVIYIQRIIKEKKEEILLGGH